MSQVDETQDQWEHNPDHELLVAFLDGELTKDESADLQSRLQREPKLQEQLESLRSTWNMLDDLPQTPLNINLTQTTMELVALDIKQQEEKRRVQWWILSAGLMLLGLGVGIALAAWNVRAQRVSLQRDLALLANFQSFRDLDSLEILPELSKLKNWEIFLKSTPDDLPSVPVDVAEREAWLKNRTDTQRLAMAEVKQIFDRLPLDEQQHLRDVEQKIASQSNSGDLTEMVKAYTNLLRSLTTNERAKILDKPAAERVDDLQAIIQRKRVSTLAQNMSENDQNAIRRWARELIWEKPDWWTSRNSNSGLRPGDELRVLWQGLMRRRMESGSSPLESDDIARLREVLSNEANEILADVDEYELDLTVGQWIGAVMARDRNFSLKEPDFNELYTTYTGVSESEREAYDWMSPSEAKQALTRRYFGRGFSESLREQRRGNE